MKAPTANRDGASTGVQWADGSRQGNLTFGDIQAARATTGGALSTARPPRLRAILDPLHRRHADSQHFGDLGRRELLDISQDKSCPERLGQFLDGSVQRFCTKDCRQNFNTACRIWAGAEFEAERVSIDQLRTYLGQRACCVQRDSASERGKRPPETGTSPVRPLGGAAHQ